MWVASHAGQAVLMTVAASLPCYGSAGAQLHWRKSGASEPWLCPQTDYTTYECKIHPSFGAAGGRAGARGRVHLLWRPADAADRRPQQAGGPGGRLAGLPAHAQGLTRLARRPPGKSRRPARTRMLLCAAWRCVAAWPLMALRGTWRSFVGAPARAQPDTRWGEVLCSGASGSAVRQHAATRMGRPPLR